MASNIVSGRSTVLLTADHGRSHVLPCGGCGGGARVGVPEIAMMYAQILVVNVRDNK